MPCNDSLGILLLAVYRVFWEIQPRSFYASGVRQRCGVLGR